MADLLEDVQAEHDDLAGLLAGIDEAAWETPTPAPGWSVRDQISHLAHFDRVTGIALTDPEAFAVIRRAANDIQRYVDAVSAEGVGRSGSEMLDWWASERAGMLDAFRAAPPGMRVPWFGPAMSVPSKATARLMETWAHGQDIVDALGLERPPTDRLRNVAHIGARALPNSFIAQGRPVPDTPVFVCVVGPGGDEWTWGPADAADRVTGSALEFCLVVTQRRHVADTRLVVTGPVATEWIGIAQAFAGPPGEGRRPGQFAPAPG